MTKYWTLFAMFLIFHTQSIAQLPIITYRISDLAGNTVSGINIHLQVQLQSAGNIEYQEIHYPISVNNEGMALIIFSGSTVISKTEGTPTWTGAQKKVIIKADLDGLTGINDFPITVQQPLELNIAPYAKYAQRSDTSKYSQSISQLPSGLIVDSNVAINAARQGTKISPAFGSQAISTSSTLSAMGNVIIGGNAGSSQIRLLEPSASGTNYSAFTAQTQSANIVYTLPASAPTTGQVLTAGSTPTTLQWSTPSSGGSGGFTHYLGEEYLGGIIYYLYFDASGIERGLVVSKIESATVSWSGNTVVGANRTSDGDYNTPFMPTAAGTAHKWVEDNLNTGGVTGWFIPSIDELLLLFSHRFHVNRSPAAGLTLITGDSYWSSTEVDNTKAWSFSSTTNSTSHSNKGNTYSLRGVKAF